MTPYAPSDCGNIAGDAPWTNPKWTESDVKFNGSQNSTWPGTSSTTMHFFNELPTKTGNVANYAPSQVAVVVRVLDPPADKNVVLNCV